MKTGLKCFTALATLALAGNVLAASITVPPIAIQKGTSADLNIAFTGDATTTNLDITLNYDEAVVDEANIAANCIKPTELTSWSCSVDTANNQVKAIGFQLGASAVSNTDPIVVVTLPVLPGATSGDSVSTFTANFFDVGGGDTGSQTDVDWTLTVTDGPQPVFGSNPTAAAGVTMSGQISNIIAADVIIDNTGGETGSTLTYTCTETDDADNVFSLAGDTTNHSLAVGVLGTVSIGCDSSTIGVYSGEMQCSHNAAGTPATFALSCTVTAGPEPAFTGVGAGLAMDAPQEGDTDPTGSLTITNTGDTGTTLSGTCSLTGPDAQISLSGSGAFSVAEGAGGAVIGVACDASAEGDYANTLSCAHNGTNVATPATYPVTCSVGPAGAAIYQSTPSAGSTIEMTPEDVPEGATVADQNLIISNAATDPNDNDLILTSCAYTGDAAITVATAAVSPIAPNGSTTATFSCDTSAVGDYNGSYACDYSVDGSNTSSATASYPIHCGVRAAGSDLDASPQPGVINMVVPMNGTGYSIITFSEQLDEGVDASVDSCTLADGSNFTILTAFPLVVPAGGSAIVEVEGTDPMDGSLSATDVLTCVGTDSDGTETGVWDLNLTVQTAAIPTLSVWGLLAMFLTMLSLGGIMIRRKASS